MISTFTVSLSNIIDEFSLNTSYMPVDPNLVLISSKNVSRPGLELAGFLDYFDSSCIAIMGTTEMSFLKKFNSEERLNAIDKVFKKKPPAVIIAKNIEPYNEIIEIAKKYKIPILRSSDMTSTLLGEVIAYMNIQLAPRITRSGVLVEVYGEGVFLTGSSGVGKSETAIELVKRGHRLVADDAVEIRKISKDSLIGSSPENIRHFIELRGIGIVNARSLFGMGSIKLNEKIDVVMKLEPWDDNKVYDRMGANDNFTEILGVKVPILTIPVKPGRNLAVIIEVASMNNRQKKMGRNAAKELLANLGLGQSQINQSISSNFDFKA